MIRRRKPLNPGAKGLKRTELKRSGPIKQRRSNGDASPVGPTPQRSNGSGPTKARKPIKPSMPGKSAAERDARDLVWARASRETDYPLCEVCGLKPPDEYQHRKAKAHCTRAERWAPANGLAVCGHGNLYGCHGRIHQNPIEAEQHGWTVLSGQDPLLESVVRLGVRVLFDNAGGFAPHPRQTEEAA